MSFSYPCEQWAAVTTHWWWMAVPPQLCLSYRRKDTLNFPPIILLKYDLFFYIQINSPYTAISQYLSPFRSQLYLELVAQLSFKLKNTNKKIKYP